MPKLKRVNVEIRGNNFDLTPKQLINKLSKIDYWDFIEFFELNPMDKFNHFKYKDKIIKLINNEFQSVSHLYRESKLDRLEILRQDERSSENLDQPTYPHGWYQKQDNEVIYGKEVKK